jgi:hypothetical protein
MDKKLRRLMNGHKVQFKHSELEHLPHDIFDDVNANIIMKNHMKGKGVRIQLSPDECECLGGKIKWGKIGKKITNTAKSVGHEIKDAGMDAKHYLGDTENRKYGKKVMSVVNWQNKNLQKIANSSVVQNSPFGNTISALAQANDQGVEFLNDFHKARKEKGGLGKDLMNATKANVKRKVNNAVNNAVGYAQSGVNNAVSNAKSNIANNINDAVNSYMGSGLTEDLKGALLTAYGQEKKKLKGQVRKQVLNGIDYAQNEGKQRVQNRIKNSKPYITAQEKINAELAKGGSFTGTLGGSFKGNGIHIAGGSFRPNGGAIYDDMSPFLRPDQDAFNPLKPRSLKSQKGN